MYKINELCKSVSKQLWCFFSSYNYVASLSPTLFRWIALKVLQSLARYSIMVKILIIISYNNFNKNIQTASANINERLINMCEFNVECNSQMPFNFHRIPPHSSAYKKRRRHAFSKTLCAHHGYGSVKQIEEPQSLWITPPQADPLILNKKDVWCTVETMGSWRCSELSEIKRYCKKTHRKCTDKWWRKH